MVTYMDAMATTIQISGELLKKLKSMKQYEKQSYEDIIWDMLEDTMELSDETKRRIEKSVREYEKTGKSYTLEQVKRELKIR